MPKHYTAGLAILFLLLIVGSFLIGALPTASLQASSKPQQNSSESPNDLSSRQAQESAFDLVSDTTLPDKISDLTIIPSGEAAVVDVQGRLWIVNPNTDSGLRQININLPTNFSNPIVHWVSQSNRLYLAYGTKDITDIGLLQINLSDNTFKRYTLKSRGYSPSKIVYDSILKRIYIGTGDATGVGVYTTIFKFDEPTNSFSTFKEILGNVYHMTNNPDTGVIFIKSNSYARGPKLVFHHIYALKSDGTVAWNKEVSSPAFGDEESSVSFGGFDIDDTKQEIFVSQKNGTQYSIVVLSQEDGSQKRTYSISHPYVVNLILDLQKNVLYYTAREQTNIKLVVYDYQKGEKTKELLVGQEVDYRHNALLNSIGDVYLANGNKMGIYSTKISVRTECGLPVCADADEDFLWDNWEEIGIDANYDGTIDLNLKAIGANKFRKDIFIEIDYMEGERPQISALENVQHAFAHAPVCNEDEGGKCPADVLPGIALQWSLDEQVPTIDPLLFDTEGSGLLDDFNDLKWGGGNRFLGNRDILCGNSSTSAHFGTQQDRSSNNCENIIKAKRQVYRYAIFAKRLVGNADTSGVSEPGGNDFVITLASWNFNVPTIVGGVGKDVYQASTFMHELGHTLGLQHGGEQGDDLTFDNLNTEANEGFDLYNCKPNYFSIMNYLYQFPTFDPERPLDYSSKSVDLDEDNLNEDVGIKVPMGRKIQFNAYSPLNWRYYIPSFKTGSAVDWNGNGEFNNKGVKRDINNTVPFCVRSSPGQLLRGHDDWVNLDYNFRDNVTQYAEGINRITTQEEISKDIILSTMKSTDYDGDGTPNLYDLYPSISNHQVYVSIIMY
jgi:hypothetical protein